MQAEAAMAQQAHCGYTYYGYNYYGYTYYGYTYHGRRRRYSGRAACCAYTYLLTHAQGRRGGGESRCIANA